MTKPTRMLFVPKWDPRPIGRRIVRIKVLCLCLLFAVGTPAQQETAGIANGSKPTLTTFEAPGAGKGMRQGTVPVSINTAGVVTGFDLDANNLRHGFVRVNDKISIFEAGGAGKGFHQGTFPFSINAAGTIAGYYIDANSARHGFVRASTGKITTFNVSGAGAGSNEGTFPISINALGVIAGYYIDASNVYHGFERVATGKITKFDVSGAGTGAGQGTGILSINAAGAIAGTYIDASNVYHLQGSQCRHRRASGDRPHQHQLSRGDRGNLPCDGLCASRLRASCRWQNNYL